jgi:hypothetical protein
MTTFAPTPEQLAILAAARETNTSLMIEAMAGCAKTTTLTMMAKALPLRPSLALAFNRRIKEELEVKFPTHFKVQTMNSLGHGAWCKTIGKRASIDPDKLGKILKKVLKDQGMADSANPEDFSLILQLVRHARSSGLVHRSFSELHPGLLSDDDEGWERVADSCYAEMSDLHLDAARSVLKLSTEMAYAGELDYDDQIYMSALFGGIFPKFPVVMVDEAQDLSPLNHIQLRKVAADRLIVCGDPRQAIYAFRGADSRSMQSLRAMRESWIDLPLSLTFRCPRNIVVRQHHHAVRFTAAAGNAEGTVYEWARDTEDNPDGQPWTIKQVEDLAPGAIAILCRNNAPLFAAALRIIKTGRGVMLMGGEISKGLIVLARKICRDLTADVPTTITLIDEWREQEVAKARANKKEAHVAVINDKVECLLAVCENADIKSAEGIISTLTTMFAKGSLRIILATGHKAKGLEWPIVVHLDPWRVPSKYALQRAEFGDTAPLEQENNLRYVLETRSQNILVNANLSMLEGGSSHGN